MINLILGPIIRRIVLKVALDNLPKIAQVLIPLIEKFGTKFFVAAGSVAALWHLGNTGKIDNEYVLAASVVAVAGTYFVARHKQEEMIISEDKK